MELRSKLSQSITLVNVFELKKPALTAAVEEAMKALESTGNVDKAELLHAGTRYVISMATSYSNDLSTLAEITIRGYLRGDWNNALPWMEQVLLGVTEWSKETRVELELFSNQCLTIRHNKFIARRLQFGPIHVSHISYVTLYSPTYECVVLLF